MFLASEGLYGDIIFFVLARSQWMLFKGNDWQGECEQTIVGLTAGWQSSRQAVQQAGKPAARQNSGRFRNSLQVASLGFSQHLMKVQCY